MKHFIWKRRQCNVLKKKTISLIKYICHNKQLKNLHKFMPMNINQHTEYQSAHYYPQFFIKLQILTFFRFFFSFFFFSIFELKIRVFDEVYAYLILQFAVLFPAQGLCKKKFNWIQWSVQDYVLKLEKKLQVLTFFFFNF